MDLEAQASSVKIFTVSFCLIIAGLIGVAVILHGQPSTPGAPSACAGGVTVLLNGKPLSAGCVLNIVAGTGVIATPKADPAIGGTDISFAADTAVVLARLTDQVGTDKALTATSNPVGCSECVLGLVYAAQVSPPLAAYTAGQMFVFTPDVPTQSGAKIDIGGLGPIAITGTCPQVCLLLAFGSPVNSFVVH